MKERKVWDLVDHPDNIKILENSWVYAIKYDANNKIVRYKARLVARGNTQLRSESFDEVMVKNGAEYVGGNIEELFYEARQNMQRQHKAWEKYYNRKRRMVNITVNDLVLD
ncbi:hypothetical protein TNCV_3225321 [Trichonephila clavipes]|nr:hypothetical protein TNCV_3225321 [Trichonephila clavipes]